MSEKYLIWSNEHHAWWGPNKRGYVNHSSDAGRYSRERALDICTNAMPGRRGYEAIHEIPVRLEDVETMLKCFRETYPGFDPEPPR